MESEASKTTGEAIKTQTLNKQQLKTNTTLKSVTINFPKTQNPPTVMRKITVTWPPEKENPWLIVFLEKVNRWPKMLVTKRYSYLRSAIMILNLKHDRVPRTSITNPWIKLSTIETYLTEASLEHAKALIDMYWNGQGKKNYQPRTCGPTLTLALVFWNSTSLGCHRHDCVGGQLKDSLCQHAYLIN